MWRQAIEFDCKSITTFHRRKSKGQEIYSKYSCSLFVSNVCNGTVIKNVFNYSGMRKKRMVWLWFIWIIHGLTAYNFVKINKFTGVWAGSPLTYKVHIFYNILEKLNGN